MMYYPYGRNRFEVSDMIGKTFVTVNKVNDEKIVFTADNGDHYTFYHYQDCCETVEIKDIVGELSDLEGAPMLEAEEVTKEEEPSNSYDSQTWTFYKFGTIKGHVNISWLGSSNGYYSERVDKALVRPGEEVED